MKDLNLDDINKYVIFKQHLSEKHKSNNVLGIIEDLCGLHSTGTMEPYIALFQRSKIFTKKDLETELYEKKSIARVKCMRKTLFIQRKEMIPIVYAAINPSIISNINRYFKYFGISQLDYSNLANQIKKLLKVKELSTSEIKKSVSSEINLSQIISLMADQLILLRTKPVKGWKDRRSKYTLFTNYFPQLDLKKFTEQEAINILVENYIKAYGPVSEKDIAWWSGLGKQKIRKGLKSIEEDLEKLTLQQGSIEYMMNKDDLIAMNGYSDDNEKIINLLPLLDSYIMGYKDRGRYIDESNYFYAFDKSGNSTSTIILNGRIIGIWDVLEKPKPMIKIFLFKSHTEEILEKIHREALKLGKFITGKEVAIYKCKSMIPLNEKTAGSFMKPLKDS